MNYNRSLLINLFSVFSDTSKFNNILKAGIAVLAFFAGIKLYFYAVIALSMIDCFTGVWASMKKGEKFKSSILRKGLIQKVVLYNLLMISVFIIEMIIKSGYSYEHYYLVMFSTVVIALNELVSIFENVLIINPSFLFLNRFIGIAKKAQDETINKVESKVDDAVDKVAENI